MTTTSAQYEMCDACKRPIMKGDSQRVIHAYKLHNTDDCFDMYATKVERGMLKVPFTVDANTLKNTRKHPKA